MPQVFSIFMLLWVLLVAAPVHAQTITGKGTAGYTSSEWYDRSTKDSTSRAGEYMDCAKKGMIYSPKSTVMAPDGEGCIGMEKIGFEFSANREGLKVQNPDGSWPPNFVGLKGPTGGAGTHSMAASWITGSWTECDPVSRTQTRNVTCSGASRAACAGSGQEPESSRACTPACSGSWVATWTECNNGTQTSTYSCNGACCNDAQPPAGSQSCVGTGTWVAQYGTCTATPRWDTGEWSACSGGTRTRTVTCVGQEGTTPVTGHYCSTSGGCADPAPTGATGPACALTCQGAAIAQPAASEPCTEQTGTWVAQACNANPQWVAAAWGACSAQGCGASGQQTRAITCNGQGTQAYACSTSGGCATPQPAPTPCHAACTGAQPAATQACTGSCAHVGTFCECLPAGQLLRYSWLFGQQQPRMTQWGYDCSHIQSGPSGPESWMLCNHNGTMTCIGSNITRDGMIRECH